MTRQEAVAILKSKMDGSVDTSYEWTEAVRVAIDALEQNTVSEETYTREYNLRKKAEWEAYILERKLAEIVEIVHS